MQRAHGTARRRRAAAAWALAATLALGTLAGCGVYSFTGAVIPGHLQTIAIPLAEDRSVGGPPGLDQELTDLLVNRFVGRTRLALVPDEADADAVLYATIERYDNQPTAVTGQDVAARNRVSVTVRIRYVDRVEDRERMARTFSAQDEYDAANVDLEAETAIEVLRRIADDAFTAATSDW